MLLLDRTAVHFVIIASTDAAHRPIFEQQMTLINQLKNTDSELVKRIKRIINML